MVELKQISQKPHHIKIDTLIGSSFTLVTPNLNNWHMDTSNSIMEIIYKLNFRMPDIITHQTFMFMLVKTLILLDGMEKLHMYHLTLEMVHSDKERISNIPKIYLDGTLLRRQF